MKTNKKHTKNSPKNICKINENTQIDKSMKGKKNILLMRTSLVYICIGGEF